MVTLVRVTQEMYFSFLVYLSDLEVVCFRPITI